jgi:hypothetical protein
VVTYRLLPYRVDVVVEPGLAPAFEALVPRSVQPVDPRATQRYEVVGSGPFEVLEEGDHLATVGDDREAVSLVASRSVARLMDYLSLGGWVTLDAGIVRVAGRRALVVGGSESFRASVLERLRLDGHDVEGADLVFTRAGEAVCLPTAASSPHLALGRVDLGVVLGAVAGRGAEARPISAGELVRAVLGSVVPVRESARELLQACSALVGDADGFALAGEDLGAAAEQLLASAHLDA